MTTTIAQLWSGSLEPVSHLGNRNSEMLELECLMDRNLEKVRNVLGDSGIELLQKYHDCILEYVVISNEQAFCDGYCLGARLTAEALTSVT